MAGATHHSTPPQRPGAKPAAPATPAAARDARVVRHLRSGLVIRLTEEDGRTLAAVRGEVDLDCADLLEQVLTHALHSAPGGLRVDLSGVRFFDCAGLNSLLRAAATAAPGSAGMTVTSVSAAVARVLDLTRTWAVFPSAAVAPRAAAVRPAVEQAHPA
ncbi:STAS domain-containing protein [Streptomyces sp. NPDC049040]|uniref:STAS domain-containing protein n=1 Tax=Streptomyces sp. NPDC049040 TaxID=3365593 RepID=UPI003712EAF2